MGHFRRLYSEKSSAILSRVVERGGVVSFLYDPEGRRKYLTIAERRAFLGAAQQLSGHQRTFCNVLAYTGARLSEVLALTPQRIDFAARVVIFESLKKRRRGVYRAVPIPPAMLDELDLVHGVRAAQQDEPSAKKSLWRFRRTTAWKLIKRTMAKALIHGPQACPKGLRHAFAIAALQAGVPINFVRKWLGHARLTTTEIYADAVGEEEQFIARKLWETF